MPQLTPAQQPHPTDLELKRDSLQEEESLLLSRLADNDFAQLWPSFQSQLDDLNVEIFLLEEEIRAQESPFETTDIFRFAMMGGIPTAGSFQVGGRNATY